MTYQVTDLAMLRGSEALAGPTPAKLRPAYGLSRAIDVTLACVALVIFAPLMAVLAVLVKLQDGGPALFRQSRIGLGGQPFYCLKFRSMLVDAEARLAAHLQADPEAREEWMRDHKLRNDPRITGLGLFLRRASLDELPQLFNVLKGEMSLVGPRPIVAAEVSRYGFRFRDYCSVKPGITGLWQVSGRNDVNYRRRVALDVAYARSKSLVLDVKILFATVAVVLLRRGSY